MKIFLVNFASLIFHLYSERQSQSFWERISQTAPETPWRDCNFVRIMGTTRTLYIARNQGVYDIPYDIPF